MPDLVESMAYVAAHGTPWHGKGVPVTDDMTPEQIVAAANIVWTVDKQPVYQQMPDGSFRAVPNRFNLVRDRDNKVLDIVSGIYKPVQNIEAVTFFDQFTKAAQMNMETCGSIDGGRIIWALASINDGFTLAGGDRVNGYVMLSFPHGTGESRLIKFTQVRVVCNNTRMAALRGSGACWKGSHAQAFDDNAKTAAAEYLGLAKTELQKAQEQAEFLSSVQVPSYQNLINYVAEVSGSDLIECTLQEQEAQQNGDVIEALVAATEAERKVREIRETDLNKAGKMILDSILNGPGSELQSSAGTYWGALNGVTHYVDHKAGSNQDTRLTNAWFGQRAALKNKAADIAVEYATVAR